MNSFRIRFLQLKGESGQVLILTAVGLIAIIGFIALAVDVGNMRLVRRQLQAAADSAALAGALEIKQCAQVAACSTMRSAVQSSLVESGFPGSTLLISCDTTPVAGLELVLNNGPCTLGSNDPHANNIGYVEVVLSEPAPTYFAQVLGLSSAPLLVRAEAGRYDGGRCGYVLDPTGSNALVINSGTTIDSTCGLVVESTSLNASTCTSATVNATLVGVVGGFNSNGCVINGSYFLNMRVPTPADPLASLPRPSVPPCGTTTTTPYHGSPSALTITGTVTLYADYAYCGGIAIQNGANVTFASGNYVLTSTNAGVPTTPGGLSIQVGAIVAGAGVMFYNYGPSGGITMTYSASTGSINLTAPTSGTYSGMLFFQDSGNTSADSLTGAPAWNTSLTGTYYFPNSAVNYSYDGSSAYNLLLAKDLTISKPSSTITHVALAHANDYSSLAGNQPPTATGAVLVQ